MGLGPPLHDPQNRRVFRHVCNRRSGDRHWKRADCGLWISTRLEQKPASIYFQFERESGGSDIDSIQVDRGRAFVTFEDLEGSEWNLFCKT